MMGGKREGLSGTAIEDTTTKPRGCGIMGERWGWLGCGEVVGGGMQTTVLE